MEYMKHGPAAIKAMYGLELHLQKCGLEKKLMHLVKLRASLINGCAFCIDLHTDEALADGEHSARLYLLGVWRETTLFSEREQVALEWTEAVTVITKGGPSDELYARALQQFTEEELVDLNLAVVAINGWNRFAITFHAQPALKSMRPTEA